MSIQVSVDELFAEIGDWGPGFLATVGDDGRVRFVALRPEVVAVAGGRVLRFGGAGRSALANAAVRDHVSVAFAPHAGSQGYSLIVDGIATVDPDAGSLDLRPLTAVRHRPAP